jgi:myo-inositol-1(or 4)-monophosphatase
VEGNLSRLAGGAIAVAVEAGSLALKGLGGHPQATRKGPYDIQIDTDVESEEAIVPRLRELLPGSEVSSEELDIPIDWDKPNVWIVDPLDGSNNYYAAIPYLAVSIGLRQNQRLVLAVVHDPVLGQSFSACDGMGARQGARRLHAIPRSAMDQATVSLVTNYSPEGRNAGQKLYNRLNSLVRRVTTLWAPAADLVRVATGHIDAVVSINASYGDVCSGLLILSEAGGTILSFDGAHLDVVNLDPLQPVSFIASVSDALATQLLRNLQTALDVVTSS